MSEQVIIKKVIKKSGGHGSTAWKIALADFMTALMIVFFVLWVTASTDPEVAAGISSHFTGKATINMDGEVKEVDRIKEMFDDLRNKIDDDIKLTYDEENDVVKAELQSDVFFDSGSSLMSKAAEGPMDSIAETLGSTGMYVHVYGYADNTPVLGSADFRTNLELSTLRALSVSYYLVEKGVPQNYITVHGEGELNPIASNSTYSGKKSNRRVELYISLTPYPKRPYNPFVDVDINAGGADGEVEADGEQPSVDEEDA